MTAAAFLKTLRETLTADLGPDWVVCAADDDFAALTVLTQPGVDSFRLVVQIADLEPEGTTDGGLLCQMLTRCIVQTKRGMGEDATAEAEYALLDGAECIRRHMMAIIFQLPGAAAYTAADLAAGTPPHGTLGQFSHAGEGPYAPPVDDVLLEHPAREVRFRNKIVLSTPDNLRPVYLPE